MYIELAGSGFHGIANRFVYSTMFISSTAVIIILECNSDSWTNSNLYARFGILNKAEYLVKKIIWLKSSKRDLIKFPTEVRREIGYALYVSQLGETHSSAKIFKGCGSGVYEIVSNYNTNTYRAVYVIQVQECIYVLHSFQKKSKRGIKTPREELNVIKERLKYLKSILK